MFSKLKLILLAAVPLCWSACTGIDENLEPCEIYLEFVYDHNMEYVCSFTTHVPTVDVLVFDEQGNYLFTKVADCPTELIDGNKMRLSDELPFGSYKILTVGGLTEHFSVSHFDGTACATNATRLEDVHLSLTRSSAEVSHEFDALWMGDIVEINYTGRSSDQSVYTVPTIKNTNQFNIVLYRNDFDEYQQGHWFDDDTPVYTFEIITPEGAVYAHDNAPVVDETVMYTPHTLKLGSTLGSYAVGNLNTVRLMDYRGQSRVNGDSGYRLIVRNTRTRKEAWNVDLINLLEHFKPETKPDGTELSMQEFLDRKSVWDIAILHNGGGPADEHDAFMALAVQVGPWIVWVHDMNLQ